MRMLRRLLVLGVFAALFAAAWRFVSANSVRTDLDLVLLQLHQIPLWSALLGAFALAGAGWLWAGLRARMIERRYRKELAGLESEIHQLRNLPLAAPDLPGGPAPPARSAAGPRS